MKDESIYKTRFWDLHLPDTDDYYFKVENQKPYISDDNEVWYAIPWHVVPTYPPPFTPKEIFEASKNNINEKSIS